MEPGGLQDGGCSKDQTPPHNQAAETVDQRTKLRCKAERFDFEQNLRELEEVQVLRSGSWKGKHERSESTHVRHFLGSGLLDSASRLSLGMSQRLRADLTELLAKHKLSQQVCAAHLLPRMVVVHVVTKEHTILANPPNPPHNG